MLYELDNRATRLRYLVYVYTFQSLMFGRVKLLAYWDFYAVTSNATLSIGCRVDV